SGDKAGRAPSASFLGLEPGKSITKMSNLTCDGTMSPREGGNGDREGEGENSSTSNASVFGFQPVIPSEVWQ
ncbi:MAG: hypothetical protein WA869_01565, partial [Alloacidobacterium sp.]